MRLRILAALSMALGIFAATTGLAGPATAAPAVWTMPDVKDMVLSAAVKAVEQATGGADLDLRLVDNRNVQEVINKANWSTCAQNPPAGKEISQKTKRVILYVKRFNQKTCWS